MKKAICIPGILLILWLCMCSKDKALPELTIVSDLKNDTTLSKVFTVNPSGSDDTQALIKAFDNAKAAGPGSEVKLVQGEYHVGMIEVHDFNGFFTGEGKGKSIIFPLPDLPCKTIFDQNLSTGLIKFFGGNIRISQMSFRNPGGNPCHCDDFDIHGFADELWYYLGLLDYSIIEPIPSNHYIKAVVDGVEFIGTEGGPLGYEIFMAMMCSGDFGIGSDLPYSSADITITNCIFKNFNNAFQNLGIGTGSLIFKKNTVSNTFVAIWLQDNIGGKSQISGNKFNISPGGTGIAINNYVWGFNEIKLSNGCEYVLMDNEFIAENSWTAIDISDNRKLMGISDINNSLLMLVKNNLFDLSRTASFAIWDFFSSGTVICNNRFKGKATDAGLFAYGTEKTRIMGNNFSNMTNTEFNIVMAGNYNTLVGTYKKETILDLGKNNMITGFNVKEGESPVGQSIIDSYKIMQENMIKMRRH